MQVVLLLCALPILHKCHQAYTQQPSPVLLVLLRDEGKGGFHLCLCSMLEVGGGSVLSLSRFLDLIDFAFAQRVGGIPLQRHFLKAKHCAQGICIRPKQLPPSQMPCNEQWVPNGSKKVIKEVSLFSIFGHSLWVSTVPQSGPSKDFCIR